MEERNFGSIYWDELGDEVRALWVLAPGRLFAIWPALVNGDACFRKAGFQQWSDGVEGAEDEFPKLLTSLVGCLEKVGPAVLREGEYPQGHRSFLARIVELFRGAHNDPPASTIIDTLLAAAWDDQFAPCVVTFGDPPRAALRTSDGHDLVLMWTSDKGPDGSSVLQVVAEGRSLKRLTLDWAFLASDDRGECLELETHVRKDR